MAAQIVSTVVTAFTTTAQGIGSSVVNVFNDIFTTENGLSNLGIYCLVLVGLGFAFGLSKRIMNMRGNRG